MLPLILITSHPDFPPLIAPLADAWGLDLVVAPTWADGSTRPHHGLVVYDPQRTIPVDAVFLHQAPLLLCVHRDHNARLGGPRRSRVEPPLSFQHIITPFDHAEAYRFGLRIFFPEHWPRGSRLPDDDAVPPFPDLTAQWAKVAYPDRSPKPPQPPA